MPPIVVVLLLCNYLPTASKRFTFLFYVAYLCRNMAPTLSRPEPHPDSPYIGIYSAMRFLFKLSIRSVCSGIAPVSDDVDPKNM
ncbi:hypothetical protein F4823DRAFT_621134, partial [Ustulina deusta]